MQLSQKTGIWVEAFWTRGASFMLSLLIVWLLLKDRDLTLFILYFQLGTMPRTKGTLAVGTSGT